MKKIKFIKDWKDGIKKGDEVNYGNKAADNFVEQGFAEYVKEIKLPEPDFAKTVKEMHGRYELYEIIKEFRTRNKKHPLKIIPKGTFIYQKTLKEAGFNPSEIKRTLSKHLICVNKFPKDGKVITTNWLEQNEVKQEEKKVVLHNNTSNRLIKIDNYSDNVEAFYQQRPFFYDKSKIFWFWNTEKQCYEITDEIELMNGIEDELGLYGETVKNSVKSAYLEAFKRIGRRHKPKDAPIKWIQFKDKAFSLKTKQVYDVKPNYFFTNPIPWELGKTDQTPTMDKLFKEWVGEEYVDTLYEIIAYCCYRSYPIQVLFCMYGSGRNGKSQYLKLLTKFIGNENTVSSDLDLLAGNNYNRFESSKLFKKLVCMMGETNFGLLQSSSIIKKLTGGDLISFEMKNKDPFSDYNYSKIIIASNSLPRSEDTSEGFYRRWIIINWANQFKEGKDIIDSIPGVEFNNLALKITKILPKLLDRGEFTNQGNIEKRQQDYELASNPLSFFIENCCEVNSDFESCFVTVNELYSAYCKFLLHNKRRVISRKEFYALFDLEGYNSRRTSKTVSEMGGMEKKYISTYYFEGIKLKKNWKNFMSIMSFVHNFTISSTCKKANSKITYNLHNLHNSKIHHKCKICQETPCVGWHKGKPICEVCARYFEKQNETIQYQ